MKHANEVIPFAINGRFLAGQPAATYIVARHLTNALADLVAYSKFHEFEILAPFGADTVGARFPVREIGTMQGNLWEQIAFPLACKKRTQLNFATRSPLFARNAFTMVHDAQVFTVPDSYSKLFRLTLKANIHLAGRLQLGILTVSDFSRCELIDKGIAPADRIHTIHNGADHVLSITPQTEVLKKLGVQPRKYALALANTQVHKNIRVLIDAYNREDAPEIPLVLVGKAKKADFEKLGLSVSRKIVFAGFVSDGEMRSLQENALAFCTPSTTEGFGLPPVEGLVLGTPAIISPNGALPEVCGPGAIMADALSPEQWSAALRKLAQDGACWARLVGQGQKHTAQFTWKAAAKRLLEVVSGADNVAVDLDT